LTAPALVKEADMLRAIRAAKKLGATRVSIKKDGTIVFDIVKVDNDIGSGATDNDAPLKMRRHAKKRMDF
jgi:hypothetical protein